MEATEILECPKTGNKLRFDDANSVVAVEGSSITYPIDEGIVDFCPEVEGKVSRSYDRYASSYDAYVTSSSLPMKLFSLLFWGTDDFESAQQVLSYLPSEFDGVLLDVPVGTGVFTDSLYARYPNATIIAADHSMGMLREAKKRFERQGLNNICFVRADVAKLPVMDGAVDIVLSMAGLHAFPDKQAAVAEMRRVLHPEGSLVASCYTKGNSWRCDWFVKLWGAPKGCFSPPFFTNDDIGSYLEGFNIKRRVLMNSGIYFQAVRA